MDNPERRRFFRIDDVITLAYQPFDATQPAPLQGAKNPLDTLADIDLELNTLINALWQESPILAKTVGLLNKKIMTALHRL